MERRRTHQVSPFSSMDKQPSTFQTRRPRNAFFIFLGEVRKRYPEVRNQREISQLASKLWSELSDSERARYHHAAELENIEHHRKHFDYRPQPQARPVSKAKHERRAPMMSGDRRSDVQQRSLPSSTWVPRPSTPQRSPASPPTIDTPLLSPSLQCSSRYPSQQYPHNGYTVPALLPPNFVIRNEALTYSELKEIMVLFNH